MQSIPLVHWGYMACISTHWRPLTSICILRKSVCSGPAQDVPSVGPDLPVCFFASSNPATLGPACLMPFPLAPVQMQGLRAISPQWSAAEEPLGINPPPPEFH